MVHHVLSNPTSESTLKCREPLWTAPQPHEVEFPLWLRALRCDLGRNIDDWMRRQRETKS
jgi:hypothetical protein